MRTRLWLALMALVLSMAVGCADPGPASTSDKPVLYGGVSAGGARP